MVAESPVDMELQTQVTFLLFLFISSKLLLFQAMAPLLPGTELLMQVLTLISVLQVDLLNRTKSFFTLQFFLITAFSGYGAPSAGYGAPDAGTV